MENKQGKGLFYGLVGVATLIVAIIGATYAYFSVTQQSDDLMYGQAATAGLNVNVIRMTGWSGSEGEGLDKNTAKYVMVPQLDATLDDAILGTDLTPDDANPAKTACIDAGGSLVCSIYRIVVQNTGSAAITVEGSLNFYVSTKGDQNQTTWDETKQQYVTKTDGANNIMQHLKWAKLAAPAGVNDGEYYYADAIGDTSGTNYNATRAASIATMPTALMTYENKSFTGVTDLGYQKTPDNIVYSYKYTGSTTGADTVANKANRFFYAMEVTTDSTTTNEVTTTHYDLLAENGHLVTGKHGKYTDLIDPTDDLIVHFTDTEKTIGEGALAKTFKEAKVYNYGDQGIPTNIGANTAPENGKWYLAAKDQPGDTKVFYIVVWISENKQRQNDVDFGQFTGTVTFQSSEGSGASSTFTETAQG